ncbi:MAG: hypothetical protein QNL88_14610 [Acidobacteriota bacterium]|nr:hypothetical protein [Acidobacteriota bacterium]
MSSKRAVFWLAVAATVMLTGSTTAWSQTRHFVFPWQTDGAIDQWLEPHVVDIDRTVSAKDLLFVHLPGSYDVPLFSILILDHAARLGYPAIGLRYPNGWTMSSLCVWNSDSGCFEKARLEIVNGEDRTPLLAVNRANSITNRLVKLLEYLDERFPEDDWARFLDGFGGVDWSKVIVSGHSQGSGHAAMIGHLHRVARVAMFAGATDYSVYYGRPAPWVGEPGATPPDRHFGFGHTADALVPANLLVELWTTLGLAENRGVADVDLELPPYSEAHMLLTSAVPDGSGAFPNHSSVVVDTFTPKRSDGTPRFSVVWTAMCFPAVEPDEADSPYRRPTARLAARK